MILGSIPDCLQSGHVENPPLFSGDFDNKGGFSRFVYPDSREILHSIVFEDGDLRFRPKGEGSVNL